jgi:hypothetical protein
MRKRKRRKTTSVLHLGCCAFTLAFYKYQTEHGRTVVFFHAFSRVAGTHNGSGSACFKKLKYSYTVHVYLFYRKIVPIVPRYSGTQLCEAMNTAEHYSPDITQWRQGIDISDQTELTNLLPVTSCIVDSVAIYILVVKFRNTICPPPPQLSLHTRAALSSNSNGKWSVYNRKNSKSSLYCEMSTSQGGM